MAIVTMRQLLEARVHFGHQTRRWNPKMKRFIFGERNDIYIIDLEQTLTRVETAYAFVRDLVAKGGDVLFIGTKKQQAQDPIAGFADKCGMPYIKRWLGGMLTNFTTIRKRLTLMEQLEAREQAGEFDIMSKKEASKLGDKLEKLRGALGGMRRLRKAPGMVFIIDPSRETLAAIEANKLGIPVVAIVDTNVDPDLITYPIPGNDDAIRANELMSKVIAEAVIEGRYIASKRNPGLVAPERSDAEKAEFAADQAKARAAAAAAQAEREAKLAAAKTAAAAETTPEA